MVTFHARDQLVTLREKIAGNVLTVLVGTGGGDTVLDVSEGSGAGLSLAGGSAVIVCNLRMVGHLRGRRSAGALAGDRGPGGRCRMALGERHGERLATAEDQLGDLRPAVEPQQFARRQSAADVQ